MQKPLKTMETRPDERGVEKLICPSCENKTLLHLRPDTEAYHVGLCCKLCRFVSTVNIRPTEQGHTVEVTAWERLKRPGKNGPKSGRK